MLRKFAAMLLAAAALTSAAGSADATTVIKVGTLAPGDSPWGKEFKRWGNEVAKDTNDDVELDFQWNGQAGDETLSVEKIRSGQLDGAGVSIEPHFILVISKYVDRPVLLARTCVEHSLQNGTSTDRGQSGSFGLRLWHERS